MNKNTILIFFCISWLCFHNAHMTHDFISRNFSFYSIELGNLEVIGNIIPGLIANWMDRQGVLRTIFVVLITAGITKLFIMTYKVR